MRNPGGYLIGQGPEGIVAENDSFTCGHCSRVVFVKPREKPEDIGGFCKCCAALICGPCADQGVCVPLEETLRRMEARRDALRSYGFTPT